MDFLKSLNKDERETLEVLAFLLEKVFPIKDPEKVFFKENTESAEGESIWLYPIDNDRDPRIRYMLAAYKLRNMNAQISIMNGNTLTQNVLQNLEQVMYLLR